MSSRLPAGMDRRQPRIQDAGYKLQGNWHTSENIAFQCVRGAPGLMDDVIDLHRSLMNSPGHRANILNPDFKEIGIGLEEGDFVTGGGHFDSLMVTQNFATSAANNGPGTVTPPTPTPPAPGPIVVAPPPAPTPPVVTPVTGPGCAAHVTKGGRKTGDVVGQINVRDGDRVSAGDVLVRLDDRFLRSELAVIESQLVELMARRARLEAERDGAASVTIPPALEDFRKTVPSAAAQIGRQARRWAGSFTDQRCSRCRR